uniref:Replication-associated protein n=1 Tax=Tarsiger cyanurus Genomoviridae sp. TaxID=2814994 RepID=A0A8E7G2A4_9VIRU
MPAFLCNGRYFLVTYSQCGDLDPFLVVDKFSSLGAECIIGREHHADGGLHLHVFVDFGRKFRSRAANIFDVADHHPNISPSKGTPEKGYDYAIKDGDVVAGGLERPEPRGTGAGSLADKWTRITSAEDRDSFWELCHELDPKAAACSFSQLQKYADWKFAEVEPIYESPGGIDFVGSDVDGRDEWLQQSGIGFPESLIDTLGKKPGGPYLQRGPCERS